MSGFPLQERQAERGARVIAGRMSAESSTARHPGCLTARCVAVEDAEKRGGRCEFSEFGTSEPLGEPMPPGDHARHAARAGQR
jgi:hypothetical protein